MITSINNSTIFTKICLCVEDEKELLKLYNKVKKERPDIPCELITDCGLTEFNGVPTNTCIGIGPFWNEDIDLASDCIYKYGVVA